MAITINGSGITSANIADGTIAAADLANTYLTPTGDGSSLTNMAAGGKVRGLVKMTSNADTTYTSGSYVDSVFTLSITPSLTSSGVLILWDDEVTVQGDSNFTLRLRRNSTDISFPMKSAGNFGSSNQHGGGYGFHYVDYPGTASSVTYTVSIKVSGTVRLNGEGGYGSFTLIEVAA